MSNEYGHGENPRFMARQMTDAEIKALSAEERHDLMAECDFEPADPDICDACAAYMIDQEL